MKARVYLVEGPDGVGKSTFIANMVAADLAAGNPEPRQIHNTADDAKLPGNLFQHYRAQLLDAIDFRDNDNRSTYIDRGYLSEVVYGLVYRGKTRVSPRERLRLELLSKRAGIILLGMETPENTRRDRIELRGEVWDAKQPAVAHTYHNYFQSHGGWIIADR